MPQNPENGFLFVKLGPINEEPRGLVELPELPHGNNRAIYSHLPPGQHRLMKLTVSTLTVLLPLIVASSLNPKKLNNNIASISVTDDDDGQVQRGIGR